MNHSPEGYFLAIDRLPSTLLGKVWEAEGLVARIKAMTPGESQFLCIIRWAVVADEATELMKQVEERCPQEVVTDLRSQINDGPHSHGEDQTRWHRYRSGGERLLHFLSSSSSEQEK